ncbi:hypothetical protein PVAP13_5KG697533, partial [Panicum virgatum]
LGHVQRVCIPCRFVASFAKKKTRVPSDDPCVVSPDDAEVPFSQAQSTRVAAAVQFVVPNRRRRRIRHGERARGRFARQIQVGRRMEAHRRARMQWPQPYAV